MRTSLAAVAVAAALLAGACTDGAGSDAGLRTTTSRARATTSTTSAAAAGAVPVAKWAEGFCTAFDTWSSAVAKAGAGVAGSVDPGDVPGAKAAIEALFASAGRDTDALLAALRDGGWPDVADGDQLVDDLAARFTEYREAIAAASTAAAGLSTADATVFQGQVRALVTTVEAQLTEVGRAFEQIDAKFPSPELRAALDASCTA